MFAQRFEQGQLGNYGQADAALRGAQGFTDLDMFRAAQLEMSIVRMEQQGVRNARPMAEDAQKLIDVAVTKVGLQRLSVVAEVISRGLVFNIPNWLSVLNLQWDKGARFGTAVQTMTPGTALEGSQPSLTASNIPIYATMIGGDFGVRQMAAAARVGTPMDTTAIEEWTRATNESIEDQAVNGSVLTVSGNSAAGLLNAPNRATFAYVDNEAWTAAGHSGEDILTDVQAGITQLQNDSFFGPYTLFVNGPYNNKLNIDFKSNSDKTIRQRLEEIVNGGEGLRIVAADLLGTDRTVIAQMTSDVLDVVQGQQPTAITWSPEPGFVTMINIMACMILRPKDTAAGTSGIATGFTT